ncbi:DUF5317 domain-containing protein [Anaerosalibacter sp. Marseille-P3206]|uniref:DUF5317 domain-containing protein n=1 Tax=Anaerosalibacter sp. Marseille-P3206 TaxID=1871005 RepID=UPI000985F84E|nr:DUF5317 domain-containing protein [Anaerosalibacter sp. Marseille-P3206]
MIMESLGSALIIGKIRGGKIRNIGEICIKGWYLFVGAFLIEKSSVLVESFTDGKIAQFIQSNFSYMHIGVYLITLMGLILNMKKRGILTIFTGSLLNFISILFNGGKMPVSLKGLNFASLTEKANLLKTNDVLTHTLIDKSTKCYYLSDIIPIPQPYPFAKLISIGDIIIAVGLFLLIQRAMLSDRERGKVLDFTYRPNL